MKFSIKLLATAFIICFCTVQINAQKPNTWKFKPKTISFTTEGKTKTTIDTSYYPETAGKASKTLDNCPLNMDFETGDFTGWQCYTGVAQAPGNVNTVNNLTAVSPINGRHTIISSASTPINDPYGNFPTLCPNGSQYSIKLGNTTTGIPAGAGSGGYADVVRFTFTIDPSQNNFSLIYYYAVVLNDPSHPSYQQPRFQTKVYKASNGQLLSSCANYDFTASANLPGFQTVVQGGLTVRYKTWTPVTVNLSGYQGQTLILEFVRENCTPSGHFGYAYIDVVPNCDGIVSLIGGSNYCEGAQSVTLTAPPGYQTYNWYNSNYSTQLGTGPSLTLSPAPPNGTQLNVALFPYPGFGCDDTVTTSLIARPKPVSKFTVVDTTAVCLGANNFSFNATSTISDNSNLTYLWKFGDNTTSNSPNPSHVYLAAGTYSVQLITFNNAGCSDTSAIQMLTVLPNPTATFTIGTPINQCVLNNSYTFTNTSPPYASPTTYSWSFGDGGTSTTNPTTTHSYTTGGPYIVKLYVTQNNNTACKDSTQATIIVETKPTPLFDFYAGFGAQQCLKGNLVKVKNNSTNVGPMTYYWDFGDGFTSTLAEPTHTYTLAGNYTIKMIAFGAAGCKDSTNLPVEIYSMPIADFTINNVAQCFGGNNFMFTDNSNLNNNTSITWSWAFGDAVGTSVAQNPAYTYTFATSSPGGSIYYYPQLIVTSNKGCKDTISKQVRLYENPTPTFNIISPIQQCQKGNAYNFINTTVFSAALNYVWHFGNGNTSTIPTSASTTYATAQNYTVKLIATRADFGCVDSIAQTVEVYKNPGSSFTINNATQCLTGNSFVFSNAPVGSTYNYDWNFGDGIGTSTNASPTYSYATANGFVVKLIVNNVATSTLTCSDTTSKNVTVNVMPTVTISNKGSYTICQGTTMPITAIGGTTYQWYLNGIAIPGATNAVHNAAEGTYTVEATNQFGCKAQSLDTVFITEKKMPIPNFAWDKNCIYKPVNFFDSTIIPTGNAVSYLWDLGNNKLSTLQNPTNVYNAPGAFTVKLTVTSIPCPTQFISVQKVINVQLPPVPVEYTSINAVTGNSYTLHARPIGTNYLWRPNVQLSNDTIANPIATPTAERKYTVLITVPTGCTVTDSIYFRNFLRSEILVPKGFTPNNDGKNDVLYPILVGIKEFKFLKIYNRWGNLLFTTSSAYYGWNGLFNGVPQPSGETYTWVGEAIDDNGKTIRNGGNFILIR